MESSIKSTDLEKACLLRKPLMRESNVFRAIHRYELANLDLAVDIYDRYFCVLNYDASEAQIKTVADFIMQAYSCKGGVVKSPKRDPHNKGWVDELKSLGEATPEWFWVKENGMQFKVTLTQKQHTGLFLDQRDNRAKIRQISNRKSVANLFSYTCAFSVAAAMGGATKVQSVDVSKPYLEWGKENFLQNGLDPKKHLFFADDVRDWLTRRIKNIEAKKEMPIDIVVCDPPSYASGFKVEKEWPVMAEGISKILSRQGTVLFSNNLQERNDSYFEKILEKYFKVSIAEPQLDFHGSQLARYYLCCLMT